MTFLYLIIGILSAALVGFPIRVLTKSRWTITIAMAIFASITITITKIDLIPRYYAYNFASSIRAESSLINLLAMYAPNDFHQYTQLVGNGINDDAQPEIVYTFTNNFISEQLTKNIPVASNESIYNYLALYVEMNKRLYKIDPKLVLFAEFPNKFSDQAKAGDISKNLDTAFINKLLRAKEDIILSAINNKQPLLNLTQKVRANILFASIVADLSEKYGRREVIRIFQNPQKAADQTKAAEVIISYYEDILAQGPVNSALIYKSLFTNTP